MPPFDKINYILRPNKNVERKLIVESLSALNPYFDLTTYSYIGFGSMWFVDFILMHKNLRIPEMYSIEKPRNAKRANFNRPYGCITVLDADSSEALNIFDLDCKRSIIWLDYEDGLDGPVLEDVKKVCEYAKSGSLLILTINASMDRLVKISGTRIKREDILRRLAGDLIPQTLPEYATKQNNGFSRFLPELLLTHMKRVGRISGGQERFNPLFNFFYSDGAQMITIGGMIANSEDKSLLDQCNLFEKFDFLKGEEQYIIDIPPLTIKEKLILDLMLPCENPPSEANVDSKGFHLKQSQIDSYHKFYRFYPTFGELVI